MYSINDKQIDYILNDIRRRGVEMEDLQSNLLDHICCIVEQNLKSDGDFEDFYKKTIPKFFKHELWEIEEETILLLTYKNYYTMKKAMIYGGVFSLSLIALGTGFKIFHWPGSSPLLIFGFLILSFVFFPSALYLNYSATKKGLGINMAGFAGGTIFILSVLFKVMHWPGTGPLMILGSFILLGILVPLVLISTLRESIPSKEKMIYSIGALGIIMFGSASLFKIMHWPGAAPLLILGSFVLIVLFVPFYTNMQIKANKMNPGQFVFVITLSMYAVVLTCLLAMNVTKHTIERFCRDERDNAHIVDYFTKKNQRLFSEMTNDTIQSVQTENKKLITESASKVLTVIRNIRTDLIGIMDGVFSTDCGYDPLPTHVLKLDNYDLVNASLLEIDFINGKANRLIWDKKYTLATVLKKEIENYRTVALKAAGNNDQLTNKINSLLNTDGGGIDGAGQGGSEYHITWEEKTFRNNMFISTACRLGDIEKNICLIETEILTLKN